MKKRIRVRWGFEMDVIVEDDKAMDFLNDTLPLPELNQLLDGQIMREDEGRPHCTEVFDTTYMGDAPVDAEADYDANDVEFWRAYQAGTVKSWEEFKKRKGL